MFSSFNFLKNVPKHYLGICLLGIVSGLSFNLTSFTIPYHLAEFRYSPSFIALIHLASLPYCLKPFLAPFIDKYSIPILCKKLGHRRGWAITIQVGVLCSILPFLIVEPVHNGILTVSIIPLISLCAALQDIVLDAYRIEYAKSEKELSVISTFGVTGFRIGILIGSAGGLYIADMLNWYYVYLCTFIIILSGPIIILSVGEPDVLKSKAVVNLLSFKDYAQVIKDSLFSLMQRNKKWFLIVIFILLYKSADTIPAAMSSLFLMNLSFSTTEIASISKAYGLLLMILGGTVAGILTARIGTLKSVFICGIFQLLSPIMFLLLSMIGKNLPFMFLTISLQNISSGIAGTALIIYFATLCDKQFVATQFSIISSFSSFARISLSFLSGIIAAAYSNWSIFFILNTLISVMFIPVFLLIYKNDIFKKGVK